MEQSSKMEGKSCSKVTRNPFFNFLRCYRAQAMNQHRSAVETAVQGAKIWKKLTAKQREPFEKMAEPLLKPGVQRKPRSGGSRRRRARSSRSRSRGRRTTRAVGRKRSATRRRRPTSRRSTSRRRTMAARSTRRRSRSRSVSKKRATTRRRAGSATKRRAGSVSRRRAGSAAPRKTSATRRRTGASRRRASATRRARKTSTSAARATRKRAARKRSRSRSRARSAPAKRAKRTTKARSTSRKRGRPAGARGRRRRSQTAKLESFTSPPGCEVCPKPSATGANEPPVSGLPTTATSGSVLMSQSIDEACNQSTGSAMLQHNSYDSKTAVDDLGSPLQFRMSCDKLLVGRDMDASLSTHKRTSESKKSARNRSVLSQDESADAAGQESAKRRRRPVA